MGIWNYVLQVLKQLKTGEGNFSCEKMYELPEHIKNHKTESHMKGLEWLKEFHHLYQQLSGNLSYTVILNLYY